MQWQDEQMVLGDEAIDNAHRQFFEKFQQASSAKGAEFVALFMEVNEHLIEHFAYEDDLMDASHFPSQAEHKAEHLRVLGQMNQFKKRVEQGRSIMAQSYLADTLPSWFKLHLTTMDSALVAHVKKHILEQ